MFLVDAVDLNPAFPLGLDIILGIEDAHDIVRKRVVFARDEIMPKKTICWRLVEAWRSQGKERRY